MFVVHSLARITILHTEQVGALCVDTCPSSLGSAKSAIMGVCNAGTDKILYDDAEYPDQPPSSRVDTILDYHS